MTFRNACQASVALAVIMLAPHSVHAQFSTRGGSVFGATRNYLYNRPTVSPYLNLTNPQTATGVSNYFTMVRPRLDQQEQEMAQRQQQQQMQQQVSQLQQTVQQQQQQQQMGLPTTGQIGWSQRGYPRSGIYLQYYPGMNMIRRR